MAITDRALRRIVIGAGVGIFAAVAGTSPLWATYLGRKISWLEVDKVEIAGTRLLAPHQVLAASGIREGQHLLDERSAWEEGLLANPVIQSARITRKLPNTLRVTVQEKTPVALVIHEQLRPVTGSGEILPLDPTVVQIDLPIVHGTLEDSAGAVATRRILAETERLARIDPALMAEVSEIRAVSDDGGTLLLVLPRADVVLTSGASPARTAQLRAVLADLANRATSGGNPADVPPRMKLDLRFGAQIVVAPLSSREIS